MHRFPNAPVRRQGRLRWDIETIFDEILRGLRLLGREFPQVESIGIDTWGVDYGLLDAQGPCWPTRSPTVTNARRRTSSTASTPPSAAPTSTPSTGCSSCRSPRSTSWPPSEHDALWDEAAHVVLLPDLLGYRLTGDPGH